LRTGSIGDELGKSVEHSYRDYVSRVSPHSIVDECRATTHQAQVGYATTYSANPVSTKITPAKFTQMTVAYGGYINRIARPIPAVLLSKNSRLSEVRIYRCYRVDNFAKLSVAFIGKTP
jgi:hypothetical protein